MYIINQKNYFSFLDEIEKDISTYNRFLPKLSTYLQKDFPKTYKQMLKENFPNIHKSLSKKDYEPKRYLNFLKNKGRGKISKSLSKNIDFVKKNYPSKTLDESFYRAAYDIRKIPKCVNCNNTTSFNSKLFEYNSFCCLKCKIKFESLIQTINGIKFNFNDYSKAVRKLTEERCNSISIIHLRGNNYHLDHKVSIYQAFKEKLSIDVVASIHNLEIIKSDVNLAKGIRCSLSVDELIKLHLSSTT
jgi:hypothetical protein